MGAATICGRGLAQASAQASHPAAPVSTDAPSSAPGAVPQAPPLTSIIHSNDILAHLNATIHFYRTATTFTQKVGEPSDSLFHDEAITLSTQIAQLAFQSAKAEAAMLAPASKHEEPGHHFEHAEKHASANDARDTSTASDSSAEAVTPQQKKLSDLVASTHAQIAQLQASIAALDHKISAAPASKLAALHAQRDNLQGQLDLTQSMHEALDKYQAFASTNPSDDSALGSKIARLELSAPGITPFMANLAPGSSPAAPSAATVKQRQVAAQGFIQSVNSVQSAGVLGQAEAVFSQMNTLRQLTNWMKENDALRAQVEQLHAPLVTLLRQTLQQGQALAETSAMPTPATPALSAKPGVSKTKPAKPAAATPPPVSSLQDYEQLAKRFQQISAASLPLAQETLLLDQSHANLQQWHDSINVEYEGILRSLLWLLVKIALAFGVVLILGEVWRRATIKYVHELRRRRQLLIVRRFIMSFFMGVVLISGFVSQISSLATFAGFLTAGIAVGLQTVLLSVAAYFFIVGRYGVRVGDRISVAGVTGDVMEVGLVRMYVMEHAGSGIDLYPTGRVAVFSNAVLFQATTPLYKHIPGPEYGWREVAGKLTETGDFKGAAEKITALVTSVFQKYQPEIERQHGSMAMHWDISAESPKIESRLQYVDGGLEFKVRFPVLLRHAADADDAVTRALVALSQGDPALQAAIQGSPILRTTMKI